VLARGAQVRRGKCVSEEREGVSEQIKGVSTGCTSEEGRG
jgi:hypothetical protein